MDSVDGVDLAIIGARPVGLYGAYYAGLRGLRAALADSLERSAGQIAALCPEKQIHHVAGFPAIPGNGWPARWPSRRPRSR